MKHRHLTASTAWKAGYTAPQPPKSNKGGKFPGNQPFQLRGKSK